MDQHSKFILMASLRAGSMGLRSAEILVASSSFSSRIASM